MGQNLGRCKTQTATHTPIGRNGAGSTRPLFMGSHPVSSVRNTTLCWRCGMRDRTGTAAGSSLNGRRKKTWQMQIACAEGVGEGVLLVLLSSCSITPPAGEGGPSSRWWAGCNGAGRSGRGFSLLLLFIALSHSNMMFTSLCLPSFLSGQSRYCRTLLCPPGQQYFGCGTSLEKRGAAPKYLCTTGL